MATEQAIRDGSQVTSLLVVNSSATTETLNVYGNPSTHALRVDSVSGSAVSTATLTNVSDAATNTQLSAANTSRKGWFVTNDSTVALNVNFGATASATAYTVRIPASGFYEMPMPIYTGVINGIWDSDASGAARITELS